MCSTIVLRAVWANTGRRQSPSRRQYVHSQYHRHPSHSAALDESRLSPIITVVCMPNTALEAHGGNYPAGGGFQAPDDDDDFRTAREEAASRAGSSGSSELFSSILGSIGQNRSRLDKDDIDEQGMIPPTSESIQSIVTKEE